jgi:hypothetical protein
MRYLWTFQASTELYTHFLGHPQGDHRLQVALYPSDYGSHPDPAQHRRTVGEEIEQTRGVILETPELNDTTFD